MRTLLTLVCVNRTAWPFNVRSTPRTTAIIIRLLVGFTRRRWFVTPSGSLFLYVVQGFQPDDRAVKHYCSGDWRRVSGMLSFRSSGSEPDNAMDTYLPRDVSIVRGCCFCRKVLKLPTYIPGVKRAIDPGFPNNYGSGFRPSLRTLCNERGSYLRRRHGARLHLILETQRSSERRAGVDSVMGAERSLPEVSQPVEKTGGHSFHLSHHVSASPTNVDYSGLCRRVPSGRGLGGGIFVNSANMNERDRRHRRRINKRPPSPERAHRYKSTNT